MTPEASSKISSVSFLALSLGVVVLYSFASAYVSTRWRTDITLWTDAAAKSLYKARPHYSLAFAYDSKGDFDGAAIEYRKAIESNPHYVKAYNNLGIVYGKQGKLEEAIALFERAIRMNLGDSDRVYTNLGVVYKRKGRLDLAMDSYRKAIAINPNSSEAHYNLGMAYFLQDKLDEAISAYERAIAVNPDYTKARNQLGAIYTEKGALREAIAQYRRAIEIDPAYVQAYTNLAWLYATAPDRAVRNGREAVALATKACELTEFEVVTPLDTLGAAYAEQGNFEKAMEYQKKAIEVASPEERQALQDRLRGYASGQAHRD